MQITTGDDNVESQQQQDRTAPEPNDGAAERQRRADEAGTVRVKLGRRKLFHLVSSRTVYYGSTDGTDSEWSTYDVQRRLRAKRQHGSRRTTYS